jgi:hypothetical protein
MREHIWFPDPAQRKGAEWLLDKMHTHNLPDLEQLIDVVEQVVRERTGELAELQESLARLRLRTLASALRSHEEGEEERRSLEDDQVEDSEVTF